MSQMLSSALRVKIEQLIKFVEFSLDSGDESLRELLGPTKAFLERLNGKNGQRWMEGYKRFLRDEDPFQETARRPKFDNLKKLVLTVGGKSLLSLTQEIYGKGMRYTEELNSLIKEQPALFTFPSTPETAVFFVGGFEDFFSLPSARGLVGFNQLFLDFYGLELCRPSDAFHLRAHYEKQPEREWAHMAMEPIEKPNGDLEILQLGHQILKGEVVMDKGPGKSDMYLDLHPVSEIRWSMGHDMTLIYRLKKTKHAK